MPSLISVTFGSFQNSFQKYSFSSNLRKLSMSISSNSNAFFKSGKYNWMLLTYQKDYGDGFHSETKQRLDSFVHL